MIRIGLLVDNVSVPRWVYEFIESIASIQGVKIELIILNDSGKVSKPVLNTFVYRFLRNVDRKTMPVKHNPFKRMSLDISSVPVVSVKPDQTKFSDRFPADAIEKIRLYEIDILFRFGFRILRGDILKAAKYGIISLHHGDTDAYRGGPPAFWEVVNKEAVTAVTVQQLTENLDGGNVLGKTFLRTDKNSFYRNQAKLYWAGKELLMHTLQKIVANGPSAYFEMIGQQPTGLFYSYPLYKNPDNFKSFKILLQWAGYNLRRKLWDIFFINQWQLIYSLGNSLQTSLFRYKTLRPPSDRIWADPFVLKKENSYFIFFEEKLIKNASAHISCLQFTEKGILVEKTPMKVLQEDHHLSYPFVFSYDNDDYMIPESAAVNEVTLYKAVRFPDKWEKAATLIKGARIYDATVHFHNGYWYLFCNAKNEDNLSSDVYLHIFFSKHIMQEAFKPHPLNPVYRDVRNARPAGKIFKMNGELIRPAQISAPGYGTAIQLNRIMKLSPDDFVEEKFDTITPGWNKQIKGIHTVNHENGFTVADIQTRRFRW